MRREEAKSFVLGVTSLGKKLIFAGLVFWALSSTHSFADTTFYRSNKDLTRVWSDHFATMTMMEPQGGNYRIDPDFKLGVGDTVSVSLWGKMEATHKLVIDQKGDIVIPLIGKVGVFGLTIDEARTAVKHLVDSKYSNVEIDLTLVNAQDIQVQLLGNVNKPGIYVVSPFSKVIDVLAKAGGPAEEGSVIDIKVLRNSKEIMVFNLYDYITKGDTSKNIRLQHDDVVYIPAMKNLVAIRGDVFYPGIYEIPDQFLLSKTIEMAGGMMPTVFGRKIIISRINPESQLTEVRKEISFSSSTGVLPGQEIVVQNYDTILVTTKSDSVPYTVDLYKNVKISGEVKIPGEYLLRGDEKISSLIKRAGGLKDTAFIEGIIYKKKKVEQQKRTMLDNFLKAQEKKLLEEEEELAKASMTQEAREKRQLALKNKRKKLELIGSQTVIGRMIIDYAEIEKGTQDFVLEAGDSLHVPSKPDWVLVDGAVYNPSAVPFTPGNTVDYYLNKVGGLKKSALAEEVYVIKANGQAESKKTGFTKISRGDMIIVPEE